MRCSILSLALCAALTACGGITVQSASAYTVGAADSAYVAAEAVGEVAVTSKKATAAEFHALDDKAYTALLALRAARAAGVAPDILSANAALATALADLNALGSK